MESSDYTRLDYKTINEFFPKGQFFNPKYDGYRDVGLYRSAKVKFQKLKTLDI